MTQLQLRTPSRLHFGLLGWGPHFPRQFGGVGLMIDAPGIGLTVEPASSWEAEGPLANRALRVAERLVTAGVEIPPVRIVIRHAPAEHVGLGVGTQLSLGVARLLLRLAGHHEPSAATLAALCGRGLRSGVGLHGFGRGGLIVDGGRRTDDGIPPLLAHLDFPPEWKVLIVLPDPHGGLHGSAELQAFAQLPPISEAVADRLSRLVLLGLMPAVLERDLPTFGAALSELQERVGRCFAPAQGGIYASPGLAEVVKGLAAEGLHGAGQSSWGPTLYAFSNESDGRRSQILDSIRERFALSERSAFWTSVSEHGAVLKSSAG